MKEEKEKLLQYFQEMKGLEESTRDYYIEISLDPHVEDQSVKDTFERIAKDEQRHADGIGKIITIIGNTL